MDLLTPDSLSRIFIGYSSKGESIMEAMYDVYLSDVQHPKTMLVIASLDYENSEKVSHSWFNSKNGRDYLWLNHGEQPDFIKEYSVTIITKDQFNRYL